MNCQTIEDVYKVVKDQQVSFIQLWFTDVLGMLKSFSIRPSGTGGGHDRGHGV